MSDERFTINLEDECIDDAEERIFISFLDRIDFYELCGFLNEQDEKIKELQLQLEAFKDKLCELGVSDVKLYGKRYYTGLEEWLE